MITCKLFQTSPAEWMTDERTGKQYLVLNTDSLIYDVIKQVCDNHGGHMAEPRDVLENKFLNALGTGAFMLGMTDTATDGQWVWDSDGSSVGWQNWLSWGEPNGGENENCVVFAKQLWDNMRGHEIDAWADVRCDWDGYIRSKTVNVICERRTGLFT